MSEPFCQPLKLCPLLEPANEFIATTRHMVDVIRESAAPRLDGPTGKSVLQFALACQRSAREKREVLID